MPNATKLRFLADLRRQATPRLSQTSVAKRFGLSSNQGRKSIGAWENGEQIPDKQHRVRFIGYLLDDLLLRRDLEVFEEFWNILAKEWGWEVLSDDEWYAHVMATRPSKVQSIDDIPPPPEPTRPPEIPDFVGRKEELSHYTELLETNGLAVIAGTAGVGKTALMARLVRDVAGMGRAFWHAFHPDEEVRSLLWKLAGFLYLRGQQQVWRVLNTAQQSVGESSMPLEVLLDYVLQQIQGQNYIVCLDDFHHIQDEPLVRTLLQRLRIAAQTQKVRVVLTSRIASSFIQPDLTRSLSGLNLEDTLMLINKRGLLIADDLVTELHVRTAGNAIFLSLAIGAIQYSRQPERIVGRLIEEEDISRYLLERVDGNLTEEEREVMTAVAVLLGYPATRDAIEYVMDEGGIRRELITLSDRYLLTAREGENGREYSQHSILQEFYYDLLGRRHRVEMHRRAGDFYERIELNALYAILHYHHADEVQHVIALVTVHLHDLMNQGHARLLYRILTRISIQSLTSESTLQLYIARGQLAALIGETNAARNSYENALNFVDSIDADRIDQVKLLIYLLLGDLLKHDAPQDAMSWIRRGAGLAVDRYPLEEAEFRIKEGSVLMALGNYADALTSVNRGFAQLPTEPNHIHVRALTNLSTIHYYLGDTPMAKLNAQQGMEICRRRNYHLHMLGLQSNLGVYKELAGDWDGAVTDYLGALSIAQELGSVINQIQLHNNLGILYTNRGDDGHAVTHLAQAITIAKSHNLIRHLSFVLCSMAELRVRQQNLLDIEELLSEAETINQTIGDQAQMIEILSLRAQACLLKQQEHEALIYIQKALQLATDIGIELEAGKAYRVYAKILQTENKIDKAIEMIGKSIALLSDEIYEVACSKLRFSQLLSLSGQKERSQSVLQEAQQTLRKVGAKRELAEIEG